MDWSALFKTFGLCLISVIIEAVSVTKNGKQWFEILKQPKYSFPLKIWYIVGAVYYILFGIIAYRQFAMGRSFLSTSIVLLTLVMIFNGLSNFIAFKFRSIKWFYLIIYPFGFLLLALIIVLYPTDKTSAVLASIYFFWLLFDLYYLYNLWRLNKNTTTK